MWVGKSPWRREWVPTTVFFSGKLHGKRSLAGSSPWGHKESDMTERLLLSLCTKHTNLYSETLRVWEGSQSQLYLETK